LPGEREAGQLSQVENRQQQNISIGWAWNAARIEREIRHDSDARVSALENVEVIAAHCCANHSNIAQRH
jgi:hypothetical protein